MNIFYAKDSKGIYFFIPGPRGSALNEKGVNLCLLSER